MKTVSSSRFGFSEAEMAETFQKVLSSPNGLPKIGVFDGIYREISCRQGRPDFIALRWKNGSHEDCFPSTLGFVGASIIGLLKPKAPRTLNYIERHSEFSLNSIKRSLRSLLLSGHVALSGIESYTLGEVPGKLDVEMWAFELKLDNPKRAVFQAQQSRSYAERSIIVVPPCQARNYDRFIGTMKRWGIGLATFDPISKHFVIVKKPRRSSAFSRQHKVYALSQLYAS
jgi:hypothetical protein